MEEGEGRAKRGPSWNRARNCWNMALLRTCSNSSSGPLHGLSGDQWKHPTLQAVMENSIKHFFRGRGGGGGGGR